MSKLAAMRLSALCLLALLLATACATDDASEAQGAARAFMNPIVGAERTSIDADARTSVRALLTPDALALLGDPDSAAFLASFQRHSGVRGNPPAFRIVASETASDTARVRTLLCYPQYPAEIALLMVKTAEGWKVDGIEALGSADVSRCAG